MTCYFSHALRRLIHVNMIWLPYLYYFQFSEGFLSFSRDFWVSFIALIILGFEAVRLSHAWVVFGQRSYEQTQISAVAWGAFAIAITLVFTPKVGLAGAGLAMPMIITLSLIDPFVGELRRLLKFKHNISVNIAGLLLAWLIWFGFHYWFDTPLYACFLLPPVMIAGELIKVTWVDDNATMLFFPLVLVLIY